MGIWISVPQCRYPTGKELSGANTLLLEELGMWCTQIAMNLVDIQLEPKAPKGKGPSLLILVTLKALSQSSPALGSQVGIGVRQESTRRTCTEGSYEVNRLSCDKLTTGASTASGIKDSTLSLSSP